MEEQETTDEIWVEKYRPEQFSDVSGQEEIVNTLERSVSENDISNMLFAGSAGIGKTTSAVIIAKELYGDDWENNFLELNASDDRGIDVVRDRIKNFARSSVGDYDYRLIFLDEADSLTSDAQSALRRTMEQFSHNVRFILSCNYSSQIIDPIQSRCTVYRFTPISDEAVISRLEEIAETEGLEVTEEAYEALAYTSGGDMRSAINSLQAAAVGDETITEEKVYSITGSARPEEIENMIQTALDGEYMEARRMLNDLLLVRGMSGGDILQQLHRSIWDFDISEENAVDLADNIGEVDYRIREGADEKMQLEALLARASKQNRN